MHIARTFAVVAATTLAAIVPAAPAVAEPPAYAENTMTYHGTWVGGTAGSAALPGQTQCTVLGEEDLEGSWNMNLKKDGTATVTMALFVNGGYYTAWGGNVWNEHFTWHRTADGIVATLVGGYAPVPLTIELSGNTARFTFEGLFTCGDGFLVGSVR